MQGKRKSSNAVLLPGTHRRKQEVHIYTLRYYKPIGVLSTDCKNKRVRDRFDYKNLVDYKVQNFENRSFCCRLETTNCSVLNFSALRAATFTEKYIEIQWNALEHRQKGAKFFFRAARGQVSLENDKEHLKNSGIWKNFRAARGWESRSVD